MAAQQLGTPDEAKAMLDRAIAALKSDEPGTLSQFNDPSDQQFHDRDLYVFCFDVADGKITADSSNGLRGIDIRTPKLKDDPMGQRAYDLVQSAPQESIRTMDYSFPKPGTTEPAPKQFLETWPAMVTFCWERLGDCPQEHGLGVRGSAGATYASPFPDCR